MKTPLVALLAMACVSFAPQEPPKKAAADPAAQQEAFLADLKAGEIDKAYEKIFKGTRFAAESEKMSDETEKGISVYGDVAGFENLGLVRQGRHQALGVASLCCEQAPLNFYFTWYRKTEASPWKLTGFSFNDQAKEFWQYQK